MTTTDAKANQRLPLWWILILAPLGIPAGEALVQELRRMGMMAAVIGQTNAGNDRMLYYNGNGRYLERPAKDEIYKILP